MSRRQRRPDVGAAGAHTQVAWDRRPSAAGGEQDSLAQQGDGSVRCGGLQPFSDRGSPTIGCRRVGGGVSLWPSRVLLDQLRRLGQVSSANAWIRLGECLYPHHSRPRRSRRAGGAVSGWSLSRWWGEPPRDSWRLRLVRGWSHDQTGEVSAGAARAGCAHGVRAPGRAPLAVGGDLLDRGQVRRLARDAAQLGP
jgi:hypothetical protein